jgi:hypothetical protein
MKNYTPGPWNVERMYDGSKTIAVMRCWPSSDRSGPAIAVHAGSNWIEGGNDMAAANASLIAAAPDLHAACDGPWDVDGVRYGDAPNLLRKCASIISDSRFAQCLLDMADDIESALRKAG